LHPLQQKVVQYSLTDYSKPSEALLQAKAWNDLGGSFYKRTSKIYLQQSALHCHSYILLAAHMKAS
jgi:hypothetical protein